MPNARITGSFWSCSSLLQHHLSLQKKTAVTCYVCDGHKKVTCDVCGGEKAIRYHPFKTMPLSHNRMPLTACAMCSASGRQICLNCLGEGTVNPTITIDAAEVLS
eukprot:GHUV01028417.1.p2 GENE.GHUV01028417.1~~GHUV01028417.1.p2  ORF type:complete len:105 (+),score=19.23 GHUV01028417.1:330-644(+)